MAEPYRKVTGLWALTLAFVFAATLASGLPLQQAQPTPSPGPVQKPVGTIKAISGNAITLTTDAGSVVNVLIQESTRMVRAAPGQKDLRNAAPVTLQELQVGDRMLVLGKLTDDGKSVLASNAIVMKSSDVTAKQERDREDWQKRGVGGLVTAIDAASGTISVSTSGIGANKSVLVHVSKGTVLRRYAPDSVKFEDAAPGTIEQVKVGDQMRARGTRSADGSELAAEEIVSGAFRNVAGTVVSTDAANNSIKVMDLITKKPVILKINANSQLRSLPPVIAQRIAFQLKSGSAGAGQPQAASANGSPQGTTGQGSDSSGARPRGARDFQQMLSRMPAVALADLQKDTAVMIVATEGTATTEPTAITLLTGVEPILTASPDKGRAAMLLSPWNLGGEGGGEGGGGANP